MGGASAPTLSGPLAAIRHESVGAEAPPTTQAPLQHPRGQALPTTALDPRKRYPQRLATGTRPCPSAARPRVRSPSPRSAPSSPPRARRARPRRAPTRRSIPTRWSRATRTTRWPSPRA
ncbi:DUF6053 domain-containing protein [Lysobacter enzymogenes]|uniref:DUF6053 domain-containing protein n=1 Tax=Lysobacter enzymogenes TaxID=69 RepID=UPI003D18EADD